MERLSIARSLRLALLGLSLVLAAVAGLGVAALYQTRQDYEDDLSTAYELQVAGTNMLAAGVVEEAVLRQAASAATSAAGRSAAAAFDSAARQARALAQGDGASERLVATQVAAESEVRRLAAGGARITTASDPLSAPLERARTAAAGLTTRQVERRQEARSRARSGSRRALVAIVAGGALALVAALSLVALLIANMRRPLDELVDATRRLAAGDLSRRVEPHGPQELEELGRAFNVMTSDLAGARERIEEERRRLAITIASLGDALLITDGGSTVTSANPRAAQLVPELPVGARLAVGWLPPIGEALAGEVTIERGELTLGVTAARLGRTSPEVVWTIRDVSQRARLERLKSEFVATASHELRSPLTSIKGFVELLERSPGLEARQASWLEIVRRSTDRLVDLVNDLLDVARIEADSVELQRRPVDLRAVVEELGELMSPRLAAKEQRMTVDLSTMPPVLADPARTRQIFANLLTNAHLYTDRGGRIFVNGEAGHDRVTVIVRDTGRGIAALELEHIFDRFYRGRPDGGDAPGTGLGLSIVKSLVDLHGGAIDVQSKLGGGTTFRITLPRATQLLEAGPTAIRGKRILIVDDDRDIASLIEQKLAGLGAHTTIANSGSSALAALRTQPHDAVTMDVLMPGMSGFDVLAQIRADPNLRTLPVVFVTVLTAREQLKDEWVVNKPIDADELVAVLDSAVRAGRTRVLVVAREEVQARLSPALERLGVEQEWHASGATAALACMERRFEVALVDAGMRNPRAVMEALELRGRRMRRAVIVFTPEDADGAGELGVEVVPIDEVASAVVAALRDE